MRRKQKKKKNQIQIIEKYFAGILLVGVFFHFMREGGRVTVFYSEKPRNRIGSFVGVDTK